MSSFCVCVVIPKSVPLKTVDNDSVKQAVFQRIKAYEEYTDNADYLAFADKNDAVEKEYLTGKTKAVRFPDGTIVHVHDSRFSELFCIRDNTILEHFANEDGSEGETDDSRSLTLILDYPWSFLYSFEQYCEEYCGYKRNAEGRWGQYYNPQATWHWYCIGGDFYGRLLVKENAKDVLTLTEYQDYMAKRPAGYRRVNGARMKDIAWDKMQELKDAATRRDFEFLSEAYRLHDISEFDEDARLTDEGISRWGYKLNIKGETLEEFMNRKGATKDDTHPLSVFAFVDSQGEWHSSGDMVRVDFDSNTKPERVWKDELKSLTEAIDPDDYVVIIDCRF